MHACSPRVVGSSRILKPYKPATQSKWHKRIYLKAIRQVMEEDIWLCVMNVGQTPAYSSAGTYTIMYIHICTHSHTCTHLCQPSNIPKIGEERKLWHSVQSASWLANHSIDMLSLSSHMVLLMMTAGWRTCRGLHCSLTGG